MQTALQLSVPKISHSNTPGKCECPPGFTGDNCSEPACGSLYEKSRPKRPSNQKSCSCSTGWSGINCNMCTSDQSCGPLVENATCYTGPVPVNQNFLQCNVTNKAIVLALGDNNRPQVTFSFQKDTSSCSFEFWIAEQESFYCDLAKCETNTQYFHDRNVTSYECGSLECKCFPDRFLCGKDGSIDLSDWMTSPEEGPVGPAVFQCVDDQSTLDLPRGQRKCKFSEQHMNSLIGQFFGDPYITLQCQGSECMHYSQVPGYIRPDAGSGFSPFFVVLTLAGAFGLFASVLYTFWKQRRNESPFTYEETVPLEPDGPNSESVFQSMMMSGHTPCSLSFDNLSYVVNSQRRKDGVVRGRAVGLLQEINVLEDVRGVVNPGEVLAIMGGSGAGKTSFLDILARKNKSGVISGSIWVNERFMCDQDYRSIIGYVDQDVTLMDTLTVSETILYSALLRLPASMPLESKKVRVYETMQELGILAIANRKIGSQERRGISGGEKRRVSIACELVTSPSILFLDEPTSGLDSYNAYNVIECLVSLARNYQRTVIFTIHQPRSNIYALFDKLVLLAAGKLVYSGPAHDAVDYFSKIGFNCPLGFNIADYLVDLTMHAVETHNLLKDAAGDDADDSTGESDATSLGDFGSSKVSIKTLQENMLFTPRQQHGLAGPSVSPVIKPESKWVQPHPSLGSAGRQNSFIYENVHIRDRLQMLTDAFTNSNLAKSMQSRFGEVNEPAGVPREEQYSTTSATLRRAFSLQSILDTSNSPPSRAGWCSQFKILSGRTFKNLYRNPLLLQSQYIMSITVALACGVLFWKVKDDIAGFQNRMGVFFFICALFGFGCLSSMQVFAAERLIFVKERANRYYSPITYFMSKVLFDILPLRIIPPFILGLIIYHMIGFRADSPLFLLKFLLVLILFNLTAASVCLAFSIVFQDTSVANLLATFVMLFEMLFGGLLLNRNSLPACLSWLTHFSFFNSALEAMIVNEINGLTVVENKFGMMVNVPGAMILETFGFDALGYWRDVYRLLTTFVSFLVFGFLWLQFMVKEKRIL